MDSPAPQTELESLTQGYLEGSLTLAESARLRVLLDEEPGRVEMILTHLEAHALLHEVVGRGDWVMQAATPERPTGEGTSPAILIEGVDFRSPILEGPTRPVTRAKPAVWGSHRSRWLAMAACAASLLYVAYLRFGLPAGSPRLADVADRSTTVERAGQVLAATNGLALAPGDVLRTPGNGKVSIRYGREKTRLTLGPDSELGILDWSRGKRLALHSGQLEATVARQQWFRPLVVGTSQAEARVLGTEFLLDSWATGTRLEVKLGRVRFRRLSDGASEDIRANQCVIAADSVEFRALPRTGGILEEVWTNIPGDAVNDLLDHPDYPSRPTHRHRLTAFKTGVLQTNNYACRVIGYVHPPVTGDYRFWIASGGYAVLWLSPDEDPANKTRIASAFGGAVEEWDPPNPEFKFQKPQSPKVPLIAGKRYFIQAIQKTGTGASHLEVAWSITGAERKIISGQFLSPYEP